MGYSEDMLSINDSKALSTEHESCIKMLEDHKLSSSCTKRPDCPKCIQFEGWIRASDPTLK